MMRRKKDVNSRNNESVCRSRRFRNKRVCIKLSSGLSVADTQTTVCACAQVLVAKLPKMSCSFEEPRQPKGAVLFTGLHPSQFDYNLIPYRVNRS